MKKFVLTISKNFMKDHPRAGEPTNFEDLIRFGKKIHTIRAGAYWKKVVIEVNAGRALLSVRQWIGKPYASKQTELFQFTKLGWQPISVIHETGLTLPKVLIKNENPIIRSVGRYLTLGEIDALAENDGLLIVDFLNWFKKDVPEAGIIHFTDFRY